MIERVVNVSYMKSIKIVEVRDVTREKARKEIIDYMKENGRAYPSDIVDSLQLDFDMVLDIIKEFASEGRLKNR